MKSYTFCYITQCSPLKFNRRFGGTCRLHFRVGEQAEQQIRVKHLGSKRRLIFNRLHCVISLKIELFIIYLYIYLSMALQPLWTMAAFQFLNLRTVGRTPWTGDQPVAKLLPTHSTTQTHTHIHASSGIQTHDRSVRASEDSSCLRPRHHCDRPSEFRLLHVLRVEVYTNIWTTRFSQMIFSVHFATFIVLNFVRFCRHISCYYRKLLQ
jgi:hypothetical protein